MLDKLHSYGIELAKQTAQFSTCLSSKYGAVIIDPKTKYMIASGRNGAPRNKEHCNDIGYCLKRELGYDHFGSNVKEWQGMQYCRCSHAEINALIQAGKDAYGCIMYLYGERNGHPIIPKPCFQCTKALINAGVEKVIIRPNVDYIEINTSVLYDKYITEIINES